MHILGPEKNHVRRNCAIGGLLDYTMQNFSKNRVGVRIIDVSCKFSGSKMKWSDHSTDIRNASKFAIFLWKENPKLLFPFFILYYFIFSPNEYPDLCQHRPGHSLGKKIK